MIYFDHNATSPLSPVARAAWLEACDRYPANPSSPHRLGGRAEAALNDARERIAVRLKCSPWDIVWTSGATEANNAVFHHAARATEKEEEVWISAIEHPSVIQAARRYFGPRIRMIPATEDGETDLNWLERRLKTARPALVSLMAANNETGVLQPWMEAFDLCRAANVPFACDAAQWIGKLPAAGLGDCNFVTGCAHKFGGPLGIGFMKVPSIFHSFIMGGPQEDGRRAGTENLPGILGMAAAWEDRELEMQKGGVERRELWRDQMIDALSRFSDVTLLGLRANRLWNTVAVLMPEQKDCRRRRVVAMDKRGFAVSTGSACSSGKEKPSHVLLAMGCAPEKAGRMLRFSSGWETPESEWLALTMALKEELSAEV